MILDTKYVLHIPTHKFENESVTRINMEKVIADLESRLNKNGFHSYYKTKVEGHYKRRSFDEELITIFTSASTQPQPDKIFRQWFKDNNYELKQESFAYEKNNNLYIVEL